MNRRERRARAHEVRELTGRAEALHGQLLMTDQVLRGATERSAEVVASAHREIDAYVDAQARVVALDVDLVSDDADDSRVLEMMVEWRWRGVETVDQARNELDEEVARRSVSKSDVALLLSSIDHTALHLYQTIPKDLFALSGEALMREAAARLIAEDFGKTLMGDPRWAEMRARWVKLGWRGTTEATFNDTFVRVAAYRMAEFRDSNPSNPVDDTVLDELLDRASPERKKKMIEAFAARLQVEYDHLPRSGAEVRAFQEVDKVLAPLSRPVARQVLKEAWEAGKADAAKAEVPFEIELSGNDAKRLDAIAERWGTTREGAMDRIVREAVEKHGGDPEKLAAAAWPETWRNIINEPSGDTNSLLRSILASPIGMDMRRRTIAGMRATDADGRDLLDAANDVADATLQRRLNSVVMPTEGGEAMVVQARAALDTKRVALLNSVGIMSTVAMADRGALVVGTKDQDPVDWVSDGPWWPESLPYSDHELMRRGRDLWEGSYAKGLTDEQIRRDVVHSDAGFPAELVHFSAKWAVHAFQRLLTSHTFAAALMCSDVARDVLVGIEKQWDAFLVIVPNGMLVADRFEFSRVLVATYSFGARMLLVTADPMSRDRRAPVGLVDEAPTLADLLVSEEANLAAETPAARCFVLAKRLVAGLLLNLQHEPNFKVRKVEARPKSKGREAEPEHRIVTVGKPLEIDCRPSVKEYVEKGRVGRKHGAPTVQVMVRGHYRRQVCGVGRMERKVIWIEPFWRGPEAALIQTRPTKATP